MRRSLTVLAFASTLVIPMAPSIAAHLDGPALRIVLMVDTSAGTSDVLPQLRRGLSALLTTIPDVHEVALVSTGRRVEVRVPPTLDRKKLQNSINGLLAGDGPTPLMDALVEIDERMMRQLSGRLPVFVIVTGDGSESSQLTERDAFNRWLSTLQKRGVVAHAIVLKKGNGVPEVVAQVTVRTTGGHFETVGNGPDLALKLQALGEQIVKDAANRGN